MCMITMTKRPLVSDDVGLFDTSIATPTTIH